MTTYINASTPTGNSRRIKLLSTDLIFGGIDNVFVYPSLDIDRLKNALSDTLSSWPILAGRIFIDDNEQYFIEFSDKSIPFTYIENNQLEQWPNLPVVVDDMTILQPFIDSVQYKPEIEPLLRLKVTRLVHSGEYILGTSFCHMIGDANSNIHFLNDLSQNYQHLEPCFPPPVFERHSLNEEDSQVSLSPILKCYQNTNTRELVIARIIKEQAETDYINISFSSKQLAQLHTLAGGVHNGITVHDAFCAYIILTMNKYLFLTDDEYIRRTFMLINYRNTPDSLATNSNVINAIITTLSSDFPEPLSLSSIAKTIRQLVETTRQKDYLRKLVTSANILMAQFIKNGHVNFVWDKNEVIFNSNFKYDWANEVNFGMINQCRFHTMGLFKYYFRIFQLNPVKEDDGNWTKDNGGVEVAFRIPKELKEKFIEACEKDIAENFINVK
ncbi:unnamed protein product [Adineta steineri]|uniref:Uncharacterized protein n=1 Tax=Adineta steineri TaxID=433720 RepID=A0A813P8R5_9BILA|nr:unnamed protein product [Adineta steineri]